MGVAAVIGRSYFLWALGGVLILPEREQIDFVGHHSIISVVILVNITWCRKCTIKTVFDFDARSYARSLQFGRAAAYGSTSH